jgi:hypothetical protein
MLSNPIVFLFRFRWLKLIKNSVYYIKKSVIFISKSIYSIEKKTKKVHHET